jgi:hypothetical protein
MKIEIDDSKLVETIVKKVVEEMKPLLNHNPKNDELMTVDEVRKYLRFEKKSSVYDKSIPFLKNGNLLRFRKKHIDLWLLNPYHHDLDNYNLNHDRKGVRKKWGK